MVGTCKATTTLRESNERVTSMYAASREPRPSPCWINGVASDAFELKSHGTMQTRSAAAGQSITRADNPRVHQGKCFAPAWVRIPSPAPFSSRRWPMPPKLVSSPVSGRTLVDVCPHWPWLRTQPGSYDLRWRERFSADAALSEKQAMESGKAVPLGAAFDYLEARVSGKSARRPRARAWRASK
jgi:hypothetical protein